MTQVQTKPRQGMPAWLAILIILLVLGGGGWFMYDRIFSGRDAATADSVVVDPGERRPTIQAQHTAISRWGLGGPPEGILQRSTGAITARRGNVYIRATPAKPSYRISLEYLSSVRQSWVKGEQWQLHLLALRILDNASLAKDLQVTADQNLKLRALSDDVQLTSAERAAFETLVMEWDKAVGLAKNPVGTRLLDAVGKAGAAHLEATKAAMLRRVEQIPAVLSAQQIRQSRTWATPRPTTQPAK